MRLFSMVRSSSTRNLARLILVCLSALAACAPATPAAPAAVPTRSTSPAPAVDAAASTTAAAATTPASPARSARVTEVRDDVAMRPRSDADWRAAIVGQTLAVGGGVRTGAEARARLDLSDGSILRLAGLTEFTLQELSPQTEDPVTRFFLSLGQIWAAVLGEPAGQFEIETPSGVATVRGSYMSLAYYPATGRTLVTCLEGACRLTGASGRFTDLAGGQQAEIVGPGQDPTPARPMDAEQFAEWADRFPEAPVPAVTPAAPRTAAAPGGLRTRVPAATPGAITTDAIAGTWTGEIRGSDGVFISQLNLTIQPGCAVGEICGTYAAAAVSCSGTLALIAAQEGVFVMVEQSAGGANCPSGGVETLRLRPDGRLDWSYRYSDGTTTLNSSGLLQRR